MFASLSLCSLNTFLHNIQIRKSEDHTKVSSFSSSPLKQKKKPNSITLNIYSIRCSVFATSSWTAASNTNINYLLLCLLRLGVNSLFFLVFTENCCLCFIAWSWRAVETNAHWELNINTAESFIVWSVIHLGNKMEIGHLWFNTVLFQGFVSESKYGLCWFLTLI